MSARRCLDCDVRISANPKAMRCGSCAQRERDLGTFNRTRKDVLTICPLDGWPVEGHARCRGCSALCGPAHTQRMDRDGFCDACCRHFDRAELGRVAWAEAS